MVCDNCISYNPIYDNMYFQNPNWPRIPTSINCWEAKFGKRKKSKKISRRRKSKKALQRRSTRQRKTKRPKSKRKKSRR